MPNIEQKVRPINSQSDTNFAVIWGIILRDFWGDILRPSLKPASTI
jgi:hypothetical protein